MIEMKDVSKNFGEIQAVKSISGLIKDGNVFGLVGTNGAGKSTLLRMIAGVLKPDKGTILVDGEPVYENTVTKQKLFFIADDAYFFPNSTPKEMMEYYRMYYPCYDESRFTDLLHKFGLDEKRRIHTFSKGMKKQLSIILGICANTKYLLCDETFDGLDPVMRQAVKSLFALEITNRDFTPIIASHNLRELEDFCDHVGLLYNGGILLSKDLEDMKENIHRVQCVVEQEKKEQLIQELDVLQLEKRGSLLTVTVRGTREEIIEKIEAKHPVFCEILPLTLEEIFISETEVAGYDIKNLIF